MEGEGEEKGRLFGERGPTKPQPCAAYKCPQAGFFARGGGLKTDLQRGHRRPIGDYRHFGAEAELNGPPNLWQGALARGGRATEEASALPSIVIFMSSHESGALAWALHGSITDFAGQSGQDIQVPSDIRGGY